jgi:hypothetical protein
LFGFLEPLCALRVVEPACIHRWRDQHEADEEDDEFHGVVGMKKPAPPMRQSWLDLGC